MRKLDLEKLADRVEKGKERARKRAKAGYHLARSLGFSTYEAMTLQNSSEATIHRLAQERDTNAEGGI